MDGEPQTQTIEQTIHNVAGTQAGTARMIVFLGDVQNSSVNCVLFLSPKRTSCQENGKPWLNQGRALIDPARGLAHAKAEI
jgi:hypothetical protein